MFEAIEVLEIALVAKALGDNIVFQKTKVSRELFNATGPRACGSLQKILHMRKDVLFPHTFVP